MANDYTIQSVQVLSRGEQLAFVMTSAGSFVVGSIPDAFTDARDAGILKRVQNYEEARRYCEKTTGARR
jgi:hypothetical protein